MLRPVPTESKRRLFEKFYDDLGHIIHDSLQDEDIHEVMLNPDGKLWMDSATKGLVPIGHLSATQAFSIIHSLRLIKMANFHLKRWGRKSLAGLSLMAVSMQSAWASSSGNLPFNSTMNIIKDAISGPFLLAASVIMIVITCLMLAFGEWGDGFKKMINIVLWLSIAFAATGFITSLFGGGAVF